MSDPTVIPATVADQILDAMNTLTERLALVADAVDDLRLNLSTHRKDSADRATAADAAMRTEIAVVRTDLAAVDPQLDALGAAQVAIQAKVDALDTKVAAVHTQQDTLRADLDLIGPKIDDIRNQQAAATTA